MFRKTGKAAVLLMSMVVALSSFAGCSGPKNPSEKTEKIDETKTQLYVSNYNGGYGDAWLKAAKKRFEELNVENVYEEGKKGVQIIIENNKDSNDTIFNSIRESRNEVYFQQDIRYYNYVANDYFLDITDVVTESLTQYGEDKTIESKMTDQQTAFLKIKEKYYAIPHYVGYYNIIYDVNLFNDNRLFMDENGNFGKRNTDSGLSKGVDGVADTYDDGLPATYEEFYKLCAKIVDKGIVPITWSGQYQFYAQSLLLDLAYDYGGYDEALLNFEYSGTSKTIVDSIDANGNVTTKSVDINNNNAYELQGQAGIYHALTFMETIVRNEWYSSTSFNKSTSHTDTQDDYLLSSVDAGKTPTAMLFEGTWWENEADATFEEMAMAYGEDCGRYKRSFGFMPYPKATTDKVGEGATLVDEMNAFMFINANIDEWKIDLAKSFIRFVNTDLSLVEFTKIVNLPKALTYTMDDNDLAEMTHYGQSVMRIKNDENTKFMYGISVNPLYYNNIATLQMSRRWEWGAYTSAAKAFKDNAGMTAKDYFDGMRAKWNEESWKINYKDYLID